MVKENLETLAARTTGLIRHIMMQEEKRDIWATCGYPKEISLDAYWQRSRRDPIAGRVIRAYPDACWRGKPTVQDEQGSSPKEGQDDYSAFTDAWEQLESQHALISMFGRADRLARVGHYAVLVMGFADGGELSSELPIGNHALTFLAPYAERAATVSQTVTDPASPRFGMPEMYQITPPGKDGTGSTLTPFEVHHSRVIHIAEGLEDSDVYGTPALRGIWNRLLDIEKTMGGGAETYWLNARGGLSVEASPDVKFTPEEIEKMKSQLDDFENDLRRTLALQGASAKSITHAFYDPSGIVDKNIDLISGETGIPKRILIGNEAGQLASSEDANSFESRVDERIKAFCGPVILDPFIDRMIETGNLPVPHGVWFAKFPEASAASPEKQATIAGLRVTAAATWSNSGADQVIALEELREMIGLSPESEYDMSGGYEDLTDEEVARLGFGEDADPVEEEIPSVFRRIARRMGWQ